MSEGIRIDMAALEGVGPSVEKAMWVRVLRNTPRAELYGLFSRLWTAWDEEPERILAFFMRDNLALVREAENILALDLLTQQREDLKKEAVRQDSFAKMVVLSLGGHPVSTDPVKAFKRAVDKKSYGMVLWSLLAAGDAIAKSLSSDWHKYYRKLEVGGTGQPYLSAQVLNGVMAKHSKEHWQTGVMKLAKAHGGPENVGYFEQQGMLVAAKPALAIETLVMPDWSRYPGTQSEEDTSEDAEVDLTTTIVAAIENSPWHPESEFINSVYVEDPAELQFLPLVQALQGCFHAMPSRVLAFFIRDNPDLISAWRRLIGLNLLPWEEKMWTHAVESDSFARFATIVKASTRPATPRQPAAGFLEALEDGQFEVAAGYMTYFGSQVASGISDRWTRTYWDLFETGQLHELATAKMLHGMMKRHAQKVWRRDVSRIAAKLTDVEQRAVDACLVILEKEALAYYDTEEWAMKLYVRPDWENYPA